MTHRTADEQAGTKAAVTGATGFIGGRLCEELLGLGYRVTGLRRDTRRGSRLEEAGVSFVTGDVTDRAAVEELVRGADVVFHLAALYREARHGGDAYYHVNVGGTRTVAEAAARARVGYFSHCSTTGVLGDVDDPPADETYRYGPLDVYQESKTEAEKFILSEFAAGRLRGSVIRPTMVWGPRDTRLFKLFKGIATRRLPVIGDGGTWCHWVLVDDVAKAFVLASRTPRSHGQVYLVGGERPVTLRHTMETIARYYDVSLLPIRVPVAPVRLLGAVVEAACAPFGIEPPLHRRRVDFYVKNRAFSCEKARTELGYRPTYSFEEEVKFVARWYQENGWLGGRRDARGE